MDPLDGHQKVGCRRLCLCSLGQLTFVIGCVLTSGFPGRDRIGGDQQAASNDVLHQTDRQTDRERLSE